MKQEIRGMDAVRYTEEKGVLFDIDEEFLLEAEGKLLGRTATAEDLHNLFQEKLGRRYDPTGLLPGDVDFNLLVERHGDGWVCVPLEGNHPEQEERAVLDLLRGLLAEEDPAYEGDMLNLATEYSPELTDTGFPSWATVNLLFHAALRLVDRGVLKAVTDRNPTPEDEGNSYGNRRFFIPADMKVTLSGVLCDRCSDEMQYSSATLHRECVVRLRDVLSEVL
jgi:hypothetical protein